MSNTSKTPMETLKETLINAAKHNLNVLLVGTQGVGKTEIIRQVFDEVGLKFKYFSAPLLDPFVDVVGVPLPNKETKTLEFYKPRSFLDAEVVFFDEFNRAHPKVTNAAMEIMQFGTINGEPLPNLKMVWAAINPPNGAFHVNQVDPAVAGRFHVCIRVDAFPDPDYLSSKPQTKHGFDSISPITTKIVCQWWSALSKEQQEQCSPRTLEYLGINYESGIDLAYGVPLGVELPVAKLKHMLQSKTSDILTVDDLKDPKVRANTIKAISEGDDNVEHQVCDILTNVSAPFVFDFVDLVEAFRHETRVVFFKKIENRITKYVPTAQVDFSRFREKADVIRRFVELAKTVGLYS